MDLLDRYLQAVRFWLPKAQADDIIAELSEDIRSQIVEEERKLGRPLNNAELESIFKKRGRPVVVASRYQPQRSLIGPGLFPAYWLVLKITLGAYLGIRFLVWLGFLLSDSTFQISHVLSSIAAAWGPVWSGLFISFGWVTLVFALLDRQQSSLHGVSEWSPLSLPPVRNPSRITRVNAAFELAANLVFIVWWVTSMWSTTVFNMHGVRVVFTPVWRYFFWAFLAVVLTSAVFATVNIVQPYWTRRKAIVRLVFDCAACVVWCSIFKANVLAEIVAPNLPAARAAEIVHTINTQASRSFPFAVIACLLIVGLSDVGRFVRLKRGCSQLRKAPANSL
jgi:hypothetical protein